MNYGVKLTVLLWAKTEQALPLKGWWYSERHVFRDSCFYVGGCHRGFRDALERWVSGMLLRRCLYSFSASCTCSKKYFASLGRILKNPHSSGRTMFTVFLFKGKKSIPGGVFVVVVVFGCTCSMLTFLDPGLNLHCSCDWHHSCGHAASWTRCATQRLPGRCVNWRMVFRSK